MKKITTTLITYLTKELDTKGALEANLPKEFEVTRTEDQGKYTLTKEVKTEKENYTKIELYYKVSKNKCVRDLVKIEKYKHKELAIEHINIEIINYYKRSEQYYIYNCTIRPKEYLFGFEVKRKKGEYTKFSRELEEYELELLREAK